MSPLWGHAVGVITTVLMLIFLAIWIWAWQGRHRRVFEQMAKLPMLDDDPDPANLDDPRLDGIRRDEGERSVSAQHADHGARSTAPRPGNEGGRR